MGLEAQKNTTEAVRSVREYEIERKVKVNFNAQAAGARTQDLNRQTPSLTLPHGSHCLCGVDLCIKSKRAKNQGKFITGEIDALGTLQAQNAQIKKIAFRKILSPLMVSETTCGQDDGKAQLLSLQYQ